MNLHFARPPELRSRSRLAARAAYLTLLTWSFTGD